MKTIQSHDSRIDHISPHDQLVAVRQVDGKLSVQGITGLVG